MELGGHEGAANDAPATSTCPRCGAKVGETDSFCSQCGSPLPPAEGASKRYQHWRWIILSVLVLAVFVVVCSFAAYWRSEAAGRRHDLSASGARIAVLGRVPSLVASVDQLARLAGGRGAVATDSDALESDLLRLASSALPVSLVQRVNAELAALRADGTALLGRGASAAAAVARFTASDAAYTSAIRAFQRQ